MDYLLKRYQNNEALKKIRDKAISMFSSYCEAQISKLPPMTQTKEGDESVKIPSFSQDDEWWSRASVLEAITELENAFVKQQQVSSTNSKASASRQGDNDIPSFKIIDDSQSPTTATPIAPASVHTPPSSPPQK